MRSQLWETMANFESGLMVTQLHSALQIVLNQVHVRNRNSYMDFCTAHRMQKYHLCRRLRKLNLSCARICSRKSIYSVVSHFELAYFWRPGGHYFKILLLLI